MALIWADWQSCSSSREELLDPVRFPRETVEKLKRDMGSYAYAGQYQQRPAPREGGLFKRAWFGTVRAVPTGCVWVRAWDLAALHRAVRAVQTCIADLEANVRPRLALEAMVLAWPIPPARP